MADGNGLATVLRLMGVGSTQASGEDGGDLFGNEAAPLPLPVKGKSGPKGGRPLGARNRTTQEWASFLLARGQSPLVVLQEIYSRPTEELVDELQAMADKHAKTETVVSAAGAVVQHKTRVQVDPLAVLKIQLQAAEALGEYVHQKQPRAIEVAQRARGVVLMGEIAASEDVSDELALPLPKRPENQGE